MNLYQNPYFGKTAEKRKEFLIRRLEEHADQPFVLLITLAPTAQNQLEILSVSSYRRQAKRKGEPLIIGIAYGMHEAKQVVTQIVGDVYRLTGTAAVRDYFENK